MSLFPPRLPAARHFALTWGITEQFGGMTSAMLRRSRSFRRIGGVDVDLLTLDDGPDYPELSERLRAKVFGGGAVLSNMTTLNIGDRNADFVLRYLREQGIAVAAQDLRGPHARRVCFLPATGKAVVRKLRTQAGVVQMIQREEQALMRQLAGDAAATATARATTGRPA